MLDSADETKPHRSDKLDELLSKRPEDSQSDASPPTQTDTFAALQDLHKTLEKTPNLEDQKKLRQEMRNRVLSALSKQSR